MTSLFRRCDGCGKVLTVGFAKYDPRFPTQAFHAECVPPDGQVCPGCKEQIKFGEAATRGWHYRCWKTYNSRLAPLDKAIEDLRKLVKELRNGKP